MKNAVLVLGVAVLFASGCGQKSNQQTELGNQAYNNIIELSRGQ